MPVVCFIFTRGFRDLFFVIRYAPTNDLNDLEFKNGKIVGRRLKNIHQKCKSSIPLVRIAGRLSS